ncbi:FeoA family protein [Prosthecochloris sp.]|uniref:FeoA family protein n=1 Tax=Prosthecochloris sp. TaxID=290513 RepID=UPI0025EBEC61|nr:FeoA family protein [Prosthecochloris sp.]
MTPLTQIKQGMTGKIVGILNNGHRQQHGHGHGSHHSGAARLREMGFYEGQQVTVLQNRNGSPLLVKLQDSRMVLGRGLAKNILIGSGNI